MNTDICTQMVWPTPIFFTFHENSKRVNDHLTKYIYKWMEKDEGVVKSNRGGWHSTGDMHKRNQFREIAEWIDSKAEKVEELMSLKNGTHFELDNMWANVNYKGCYNEKHNHPLSHLSGVYYVKVPDENSEIVFYDPRVIKEMYPTDHEDNPAFWETVRFRPEEGKLILFPSYLQHSVNINNSDEDRISISFNFFQKIS